MHDLVSFGTDGGVQCCSNLFFVTDECAEEIGMPVQGERYASGGDPKPVIAPHHVNGESELFVRLSHAV